MKNLWRLVFDFRYVVQIVYIRLGLSGNLTTCGFFRLKNKEGNKERGGDGGKSKLLHKHSDLSFSFLQYFRNFILSQTNS